MTQTDRDKFNLSAMTRDRLVRELLVRGAAPRDAWSLRGKHPLQWFLTLLLMLLALYWFAQP